MFNKFKCLLILSGLLHFNCLSQDPNRFNKELSVFMNETPEEVSELKGRVLFTGSSSIRMWKDIDSYFPSKQVLNRGFGGSETSDLLYFAEDLISKYQPSRIFIYEGDNDIANGESPRAVIKETKVLIAKIRKNQPNTPIILISAKPSVARWHLKNQYLAFNEMLKNYCEQNELIEYADTWNIMLNENGELKEDLFLEDDLHMKSSGYDLWAEVLNPFLE